MNTIPTDTTNTIYTYRPEEEIWHYINKLTSMSYVHELLRRRIESRFFGLDIDNINQTKREYCNRLNLESDQQLKDASRLELNDPISEANDIRSNAEEITYTSRQAIEIYRSSQTVTLYAKPILLYYCYIRLAKVLFLATYRKGISQKGSGNHGLRMDNDNIMCQLMGAFPRFHDCYDPDPSIYLNKSVFRWQDLLEPFNSRYSLFENMRTNDAFVNVKERKSKIDNYKIHELTRELLFTYSMSMLARYRILKWSEIIEGKSSDIIWRIEDYLTNTQSFFPNLIFNKLHGERYYFYPETRLGQ